MLRHAIASKLIGDDYARHILQTLQQTLEEPLGSFAIALLLHQNIEDITILIQTVTPQIMLNVLIRMNTSSMPLIARLRRRRRRDQQAASSTAVSNAALFRH